MNKLLKNLFILIFLLSSSVALGEVSREQEASIDSAIKRAQNHYKKKTYQELKYILGESKYFVDFKFFINKNKMVRDFKLGTIETKIREELPMPGLAINISRKKSFFKTRQFTNEEITAYVKKIEFKLISTIEDTESIKPIIKDLLVSSFFKINEDNVEVLFEKLPEGLVKETINKIQVQNIKPTGSASTGGSLSHLFNIVFLLLIVGVVAFATFVFKKHFSDLVSSIEDLRIKVEFPKESNSLDVAEKDINQDLSFSSPVTDSTDDLDIWITKLKEVISKNYQLFEDYFIFKIKMKDYLIISLFFEVLNRDEFEKVAAKLSEGSKQVLDSVILNNHFNIYSKSNEYVILIQKLVQQFKIGEYNRQSFYKEILINTLEQLKPEELEILLDNSDPLHWAITLNYCNPTKLCLVLKKAKYKQSLANIDIPHLLELGLDQTKNFLNKVSSIKNIKLTKKEYSNPIERVLPYLPEELESVLSEKYGIDNNFSKMANDNIDLVIEYLEGLDLYRISSLLVILKAELRLLITNEMPQVLVRRIKTMKTTSSNDGYIEKAKLFEFLIKNGSIKEYEKASA